MSLFKHVSAAVVLVALALSTPSRAALGPTTPMPGVHPEVWRRIYDRAEAITKAVAKANPGATAQQLECAKVQVLLESFRRAQVVDKFASHAMDDVTGLFKQVRTEYFSPQADAPGGAAEKLRKEHEDRCGGGGGPGGAVAGRTMASNWLGAHADDWDVDAAYGPSMFPERVPSMKEASRQASRLRRDDPWALYLLKAGILVEAVEGAGAAAAAGLGWLIINPKLLEKKNDANQGI